MYRGGGEGGGRWYYGICLFDTSGLISNTVSVGVVSCYLIAVFRRSFLSKTVWRRTCSRHHHTENTCSLIFSFLWKKMPLFVFLFFLIKKRKEKHLSFIFHVLLPHWTPLPMSPPTHTHPLYSRGHLLCPLCPDCLKTPVMFVVRFRMFSVSDSRVTSEVGTD